MCCVCIDIVDIFIYICIVCDIVGSCVVICNIVINICDICIDTVGICIDICDVFIDILCLVACRPLSFEGACNVAPIMSLMLSHIY